MLTFVVFPCQCIDCVYIITLVHFMLDITHTVLYDVFEHATCEQCSNNVTCTGVSELFIAKVSVS